MPVLSLPGAFVDDCDVPISSADVNQLRDACVLLDGLTSRRLAACCSSGAQTCGSAADWHPRGDYRQSWWGGIFRSGMTTLTIEGVCDYQLDFYLGGVFNSSQAASPGGFTKNITLSGYSDGDATLLEIKTHGNPSTVPTGYATLYRIDDVYLSPIVVTTAWGGVPTFAGTYNAARLNQLTDAAQYIWERVTAVPIIPVVGGIMIPASHKQETIRLFDGSVGRYASNEVLRVYGNLNCRTNAEHVEIYVGGALAYTSPTYTAGQNISIAQTVTLSNTLGTRTAVAIRAVIEDNTYRAFPGVFSSYTLPAIRSEADSSGYATQAPPTAFTAEESITDTTLNARLNGLATMLSTAKARLDARPELWNRARLTRRVYANDDTQVARNFRRYAGNFVRQGDRLVVRGKGVKIGFGAISFKPPEKEGEPINYSDFTWAREESVGTQEDTAQTTIVYLDQIDGLELGMRYYVFGASSSAIEVAQEFLI